MKQTKKRRTGLLAAAMFWLAVWQAAAMAIGQEVFLVSPIQAAGTLMELLPQADFWQRVGFSAGHILLGFALGVVVSVLLAAAAELVLALPTFIDLLQITDSSLAPGLSTSTLLTLSRVCSVLSFLLMIVRGLYGKWLYRQSAAEKIRRIRAEFPDAAQRKAVLCAQGGTSWAAVLGCLVLLMVIGSAFTLLLGPNVDALIHLVYG